MANNDDFTIYDIQPWLTILANYDDLRVSM